MKNNKRVPIQLKLGKEYILIWNNFYHNKQHCKFIQTTRCGFNFLNTKTNKCILKQHLYPSKCENHFNQNYFWVNSSLSILKVT